MLDLVVRRISGFVDWDNLWNGIIYCTPMIYNDTLFLFSLCIEEQQKVYVICISVICNIVSPQWFNEYMLGFVLRCRVCIQSKTSRIIILYI